MRALLITFFTLFSLGSLQAAEVGDDGLHKQPWFEATFKDIREDIETAADENKRLAIIFEQRGCPYCKQMHETVFSDSEVVDYITEHFFVVQYNLHGSEEVTDLDGDVLPENETAKKWGLKYTPTMLFFAESAEENMSASNQAVAAMPGAADKQTTMSMLHWVVESAYEGEEEFQDYHQRRVAGTGAPKS